MALADLGAGAAKLLNGDEARLALLAAGKVERGGLAEAGDRHERRAELAVLGDEELRRIGLIEVDGRKLKAAHIELIDCVQRDEQILLVRGEIRAAAHFVYLAAHGVRAAGHHPGVEAAFLAAAVEIRAVERERQVDLEPRDAESHHDISHGVSLREEVGDLAAGLDVPIGHAPVAHLLFGVAGKLPALLDLALTHGLHRLECEGRLDADGDKVEHDIVTAADGLVDVCDAVYDEVMDVARPHVGAVREAGKPDERIELLGLGVDKHLAGERRAEFRDADGAGLADDRIVVRQAEDGGGGEDRHRVRVGEGYLLCVDALAELLGHVLHHADHGRVIVAELIELEEVCLHAVIFKMRGDYIAVRVIRRVLHGAEVRHVHILRDDDKAAGVLAGRALDADKPLSETVLLGLGGLHTVLLKVFLDIAVGGLLGEGADRPGAEDVIRTEEDFGVFMRLGLVFTGEVKVDIGRLFVAGEAKEGLERDIEAVAPHACAALGTVLLGHVRAAAVAAVGNELAVAALGADIVRRQGVDLRDAGHIRDDRGADAASAADQIAVLEGVLHELLGGHIYNVIAVVKDRVELNVDALLHYLRRVLAVDAVHLGIDEVLEVLCRVLYLWREQLLRQQLYRLDLICDGAGVRDDDFLCGLLAEVGKLRKHLIRRAEVYGAAAVGVGKFLGRLEDPAVLLVLGVEEVDVRRGDDGLAKLTAKLKDSAVIVLQHLDVTDCAVIDEEAVIADGLNFKIVIE